MTKALIVGWFSYQGMGATAGDLMAAGVARDWLIGAGRSVRVATVPELAGDITLDQVDPADVDELVFVCGPIGNGWPIPELLERFRESRPIGLDVSMLQPLGQWNPFEILFERESDRTSHPDLALASDEPLLPVIGLVEVHPQTEYGDRARHEQVGRAIREALADTQGAVLPIDTCLEPNAGGLRTAAEVESIIARCDAVVTTRLHGMVLALKNGVPAVVVDPIAGGAKVQRQAELLEWPLQFTPETADRHSIGAALARCLQPNSAALARLCADRARDSLARERQAFLRALSPELSTSTSDSARGAGAESEDHQDASGR